ncbi:hypothetical protein, partial [Nocardioides sp.]
TALGLAAADGEDRAAVQPDPVVPEVTWVVGSTLHTPHAQHDLGHEARSLVRTSEGMVFADEAGAVYSFRDGDVEKIGAGAAVEQGLPVLVSDEESSLVGWVDRAGEKPTFVTHDVATGEQTRDDAHTDASMTGEWPPNVAWYLAIEDGTAYWLDRRGTVATDLETGEARILASPEESGWVSDVENGHIVRLVEDERGGDVGGEVVDTSGQVVVPVAEGVDLGTLSPDGHRVIDYDLLSALDVRTGERVRFDVGTSDAGAYEWLDADTVAVLREGAGGDTVDLLTCEVPAGTCAVVVEGLDGERVVIPSSGFLFG